MNWGSILRTVICCVILIMLHYTVRPLLGWRAPIDFMLIAALFGAVRMRPGVAAMYGLFLGLISDALGLLLLVPPVQRAVSRTAERAVERKLREVADGSLGDAFQQARMHRPDGKVVQGEVIRDEPGTGPGGSPQGPRPPLTR